MTQQEIASHLGTTREVVARILGQLALEGHIQTGRNQIVINDPASLAEHTRLQNETKPRNRKRPNKTLQPTSPLTRRRV